MKHADPVCQAEMLMSKGIWDGNDVDTDVELSSQYETECEDWSVKL